MGSNRRLDQHPQISNPLPVFNKQTNWVSTTIEESQNYPMFNPITAPDSKPAACLLPGRQ
jgi:hypothetical protein